MAQLTITVFGSGHPRPGDPDYESARALGAELARRGFAVCTGGYAGVMEAALRGAKEAGGRTLGVTTRAFRGEANAWIDDERSAENWQARLFELIRLGQGYVVCKGGTGTLAELAVVWEMQNKGVLPARPLVVLGEFWRAVIDCVVAGEAGLAPERSEAARKLVEFAAGPGAAAERLARALHRGSPAGEG